MSSASIKPVIFISYSHKDEPEHPRDGEVQWLSFVRTYLQPAVKNDIVALWVDRNMPAGTGWDADIEQNLRACDIFILLVSAHSMASDYIIDREIALIGERQAKGESVPFYPLLLTPTPDAGLDKVRHLNLRPRDARPFSSFSYHERLAHMTEAANEIGRIAKEIAGRKAAAARVGTTRADVPREVTRASGEPYVNITGLPETAYERLVGREAELKRLDEAWADTTTNILSLIAEGGAGKSALVNEWLGRMQAENYRGAEAVLGWSFYSQGTKERATSAEEFLNWALDKLGIALATTSATAKGEAIAEALARRRVLLVLDGVEPLQHGPGTQVGQLKDRGLRALLRRLAGPPPGATHGLVVLISRLPVKDIARWMDGTAPCLDVDALSETAGAALLRDNGVWGTDRELAAAARDFGGHPLALGLLASFLAETQKGDMRRRDHFRAFLHDRENPRHDHARRVMESYEKEWLAGQPVAHAIMHMVGLFDRPASGQSLRALRQAPAIDGLTDVIVALDEGAWQRAVARLREVRLLAPLDSATPDALDAHPLVREWFGERLKEANEAAWKAAHGRLYEHLRDTTREGKTPTLEDLAPLYWAIAHGCRAGLHRETLEETYINRICRRVDSNQLQFYSTTKLGAYVSDLAAISCFFDNPFSKPVRSLSEPQNNWLLSRASSLLSACGRVSEALAVQRAGLTINEAAGRWVNAATSACNLSQAELLIGEVATAIASAATSVANADRSRNNFWMVVTRATHANALHAAGQYMDAELLFLDAERRQRQWQPRYPLLYSLQGYNYCDLLLAKGSSDGVRNRAMQTLEWVKSKQWPLYIALDALTLGRAHLALALENRLTQQVSAAVKDVRTARTELDRAIDGLRASGHSGYIPCGLLARSSFRRSVGDWGGAALDLDEVEEIAAAGLMRLHLCDMALERTRLAFARMEVFAPLKSLADENPTDSEVPSEAERKSLASEAAKQLAIAADTVEKCGYHRRDEELAELQIVLRGERTFASFLKEKEMAPRRWFQRRRDSNQGGWIAQAIDDSEACVERQFGHQVQLVHFSRAIWSRIGSDRDKFIHLSDISAAAAETSCSIDDALAVIALLSSRSVHLLRMEMKSTEAHGARVSQAEFIQKLGDWWREKKLSDAEWKQWASAVEVRWVPTMPHAGAS